MSETLTVKVDKLAPTGEGIARAEGSPRVIFVPQTVPGDTAQVEIVEAKSSFARGKVVKILSTGPQRVDPACPHHAAPSRQGPFCGGCDWQHLAYEAQLEHKRSVVVDCVERLGGLKGVEVAKTLPSPKPWGYRNKVQIPFYGEPGAPLMGFFSAGSRQIVDMRECPIQPELSVQIALTVKRLAKERRWPLYDGKTGRGWLRHLFIRTNAEGQALVGLVVTRKEFPDRESFAAELRAQHPEVIGIHQNVQQERTSVVLGPEWKRVWGAREIEETIGRFRFAVSPGAFLQVNTPAATVLYDAAKAAVKEGGKRWPMGLDLYCGVGTLTLWMSDVFPKCIGVEENHEAVKDAWRNAERNGVKTVRFTSGRAEAALPRIAGEIPDGVCVVVDPPRIGLSQPVRRFLTERKIKRVVYVSCDPATFARDAKYLAQSGYKLVRVQPVDLFPQTSHVELVGLLDRA
ncbi:MAG: 23S rRNA (uracil(1939)-C(5))-methyltransferase RlmD [Elusimicrobiota bacterium]|nr:23S rRNA (uracil(1939)-C(5))-methyltransferase RlmD [Elusimicrobiota bacterium]